MFTELSDWQREQYFKHLGNYPKWILERAKDWLIGNHQLKRIPTISEFKDAIEESFRKSQEALPDDLGQYELCEKCLGIGIVIEKHPEKDDFGTVLQNEKGFPVYKQPDTASPCPNCELGKSIKAAWIKLQRRRAA